MKNPISICENRDCMAAMAEFPDGYFDLAVVDPPYGIGLNDFGNGRRKGKKLNYKIKGDWDVAPREEYFNEVFRVSANQIIWGANNFNLPVSQAWIYWDKGQAFDVSFASGELAWTSFKRTTKHVKIQWSGSAGMGVGEKRLHPTQKPVALYKWLLTNYAKPGDKILDTHLGSGSSRIAAHDMGFDFWGYELDADYFAAMEARFKAHISKPVLFAPEQMYQFEQAKLFDQEFLEI